MLYILSVTYAAPLIILTAVTGKTGRGIDSAVYFVLVQVISPMRHRKLRRILELIAGFQLFLVRVAIGAEGLLVANITSLLVLCGVELVPRDIIRGVVQRCAAVSMAIAAYGGIFHLHRMFCRNARRVRARKEQQRNCRQKRRKNYFRDSILHAMLPPSFPGQSGNWP
jgi:hypothetical protein